MSTQTQSNTTLTTLLTPFAEKLGIGVSDYYKSLYDALFAGINAKRAEYNQQNIAVKWCIIGALNYSL
ncbi:hypothetical protein [Photobacterium leiognathi]|uniref:hypothetical protein n=1 Tax=Photobacterium leiognathi TaxID=553611 RepID=UPI002739BCE4|nr:hypothetical protein [Photobacterium leiognathi]